MSRRPAPPATSAPSAPRPFSFRIRGAVRVPGILPEDIITADPDGRLYLERPIGQAEALAIMCYMARQAPEVESFPTCTPGAVAGWLADHLPCEPVAPPEPVPPPPPAGRTFGHLTLIDGGRSA